MKNVIAWSAAMLFLLAVWGVAYLCVGNALLVPAISDCLRSLGALLVSGAFWRAFFFTLLRVGIAFVVSFALAAIFAVIAYLAPWFGRFVTPLVSVLRSTPTLAVLLILLAWTNGFVAPVAVAVMTLFPVLYTGLYAALLQTDVKLIEMSRVYKVPIKRQIVSLYVPSVLPTAVREGGAALALGLKLVASAEVLAATARSIGGMMQEAKVYLDMPLLFALVTVTFAVGLLVEALFAWAAAAVERRVK